MAESAIGCECESVSTPGACSCGTLLAFCGDCMAGSPLIIKDLDLDPQPPTNTRSPTLNSEEPTSSTTVWLFSRNLPYIGCSITGYRTVI